MPVTMLIIVHDNTIEIIPSTRDAIANPAVEHFCMHPDTAAYIDHLRSLYSVAAVSVHTDMVPHIDTVPFFCFPRRTSVFSFISVVFYYYTLNYSF